MTEAMCQHCWPRTSLCLVNIDPTLKGHHSRAVTLVGGGQFRVNGFEGGGEGLYMVAAGHRL